MHRTILTVLLTILLLAGCAQINTRLDLHRQIEALNAREAELEDREAAVNALADECTVHGEPVNRAP